MESAPSELSLVTKRLGFGDVCFFEATIQNYDLRRVTAIDTTATRS
jgi:hypothetical protein